MKKLLITYMAIFGALVCMPTLLGMAVPQRIMQQPQQPSLNRALTLQNAPIAQPAPATKKLEEIKIFSMLNPLPLEMKIEVLKNYSCLELIKLYDTLMEIKREIPGNIARENNRFKETFLEEAIDSETKLPFQQFKGDNILAAIQLAAGDKVGKIIGCSVKSMQDGTCQPLKDYPGFTDEQKAVRPFAETTGEWTKNWIKLLPVVEAMNDNQWILDRLPPFWKINFLKIIHDIDTHPENYIEDAYSPLIFFFPKPWDKQIAIPEGPAAQAPDKEWSNFYMTRVYLSLLPQALQNTVIAQLKQDKNSYFPFRLSSPVSSSNYAHYNKEMFFEKIRSLKLSDMKFSNDRFMWVSTDLSAPRWWQIWRK